MIWYYFLFAVFIIIIVYILRLRNENADLKEDSSNLRNQNADLKEDSSNLRNQVDHLNNQLDDLNKQLNITENKKALLNNRFNNAKSNLDNAKKRIETLLTFEYKYKFIMELYPELDGIFSSSTYPSVSVADSDGRIRNLFNTIDFLGKYVHSSNSLSSQHNLSKQVLILSKQVLILNKQLDFYKNSSSNLKAIPYMAQLFADYQTLDFEKLASQLDWGHSKDRIKKVKSIREIRSDSRALLELYKEAEYKLTYLLNLFPVLEEVIDCDFNELPTNTDSIITEGHHDEVKDWLTKEEYTTLNTTKRNQLALDRYRKSHNKSKWQIGRDYELYVGYMFSSLGFDVDYFGSYMQLEDLGRDLICKKGKSIIIVQCKYWSSVKEIHEKHIMQLYGTTVSYCIEHNLPIERVAGLLVTNISLSPTARRMAEYLKIKYKENVPLSDYPCIKCNIGHSESGTTHIYHLPFDQQYDSTKINKPGEFFAMTVEEAEAAGFRRARKWYSN